MSKSSLRRKFVLLKQILEDATSERSTDSAMDSHQEEDDVVKRTSTKHSSRSARPVGVYPVKFSASHKNKSCQTRLSSFPLFPVPEDIMWIDEEKGRRKSRPVPRVKKKKRESKSKDVKDAIRDGEAKQISLVKNPDGTRKEFRSEHQLKDSSNPAILAWIHRKNIDGRKQRREERREKRAKRLIIEEESRQKRQRMVESEGKVKEWFKMKRRQTWLKNRSKVSPQDGRGSSTDQTSPSPPPGYTVVKSFKCSETEGSNKESSVTGEIPTTARRGEIAKKRPKSSFEYKKENEAANHRRPLSAAPRPKTAREPRASKQNQAAGVHNDKHSSLKMQSMSYDEWLKNKREEDKKRKTQKERELIDSHLEAVIAELGKQRVEKILSPRRRVDTGLKHSDISFPKPKIHKQVPKTAKYKWVSAKKQRPEPQGCDCPDSGQDDGDSVAQLEVPERTGKGASGPGEKSEAEKPHEFCREVNDKCEQLKPSMDKVLSILDAEVKKQRVRSKTKKAESSSDDKCSVEAQKGSEADSSEPRDHLQRSRAPRPKTSKPRHSTVLSEQKDNNESGMDILDLCGSESNQVVVNDAGRFSVTTEQAAKIKSDMDVLGLCSSTSDELLGDNADKSTVRENYFDYGSDVDPLTMKPATYTATVSDEQL